MPPTSSPTPSSSLPPYPPAERLDLVEELPASAPRYRVADPYRWLEDSADERTVAWSAAQDALFASAQATWPGRERVASRVAQLLSAGGVGPPVWRGERCFRVRRDPERDHPQLLVVEPGPDGPVERVLVDPLAWDPAGRTTLDAWQPSREGHLLAFQLSEGGSEESVLRVLDVATGEVVDGPVDRLRYSPVSWLPQDDDDAARFFYVRRLAPEGLPAGEEKYHRRVWLHRVGADPDAAPADGGDVEVFGADQPVTTYYGVGTSLDGRWLAVTTSVGTSPRSDCHLADLGSGDDGAAGLVAGPPRFAPVAVGLDAHTSAGVGRDGRLYVGTDLGAPRGRLAVADPTGPAGLGPEAWRDLVGEREDAVLEDYAVLDGPELERPLLLVGWTQHAVAQLTVHDLASGEQLPGERGRVALPGPGSLGGLRGRPEGGHEAWFTWTSTAEVPCVLRWDARTGELSVEATAPGLAAMGELPAVVTRQLEVTSADGTVVRALAVARADAFDDAAGSQDGAPRAPLPTVLYGYGGFGHTMTPGYSATALAWVEAGGAWVVAGLRGGSEEGEDWHRAGMLAAKQNVFDDFLAVADALAERGWTTAAQLTISGGSNGGLLVGAALTQRPDAFAAVLCSAPLLDMVRYQLHGLGATWSPEYGDAEDPDELGWLLAYSPYHACSPDPASVEYPAVLFTVFDGDSRVDPLHARKLCAALQHATRSDPAQRPVLLRREAGVGHGARAVSRSVRLAADTLGFAAAHTGLDLTGGVTGGVTGGGTTA